jgi:hypothetical protein
MTITINVRVKMTGYGSTEYTEVEISEEMIRTMAERKALEEYYMNGAVSQELTVITTD